MNNKLYNIIERSKVKNIYFVLIFLILALHSMIFMSFDDYAYATLTYGIGNKINSIGDMSYPWKDILIYLQEIYQVWAGRILGHGMLIASLKGGEWVIQLIQTMIIFVIIVYGVKVFLPGKNFKQKIVACIALFFCIPVYIAKLSVFWYAASTLYLWPFMFFILALYILENKKHVFGIFALAILGICAGLSQEQVGLSFLVYLMSDIIFDKFINKNEINKKKLYLLMCVFVGFIILFIAPGNFVRLNGDVNSSISNMSLISKLFKAVKVLLINLTSFHRTFIFNVLIILLTFNLNKVKEVGCSIKIKKISKICMAILVCSQVLSLIDVRFYQHIIIGIVIPIQLITMIGATFILALCFKKQRVLLLLLGGLSSLIPVLVSPYFVDRMLLPLNIYYIFLIINLLFNYLDGGKCINNIMYISILIFGGICYILTFKGYFDNSIPKNINNHILKEVAKQQAIGKPLDKVILYKNLNEIYTGTQPYEVDYTDWIKSYYGVSSEIDIDYMPLPNVNKFKLVLHLIKGGELSELYGLEALDENTEIEDISAIGIYPKEQIEGKNFYWISDYMSIIMNTPKDKTLRIRLENPEQIFSSYIGLKPCIKIKVDGQEIESIYLNEGDQEIKVSLEHIQDSNFKLEIEGNISFIPSQLGESLDSRELLTKVIYIGP